MSIERAGGSAEGGSASLRTVGRGALGLLSGSAVSALANFGIAVLVARLLSQESAGIFFASTSLFALVYGVSRLAADSGLVRFISASRSAGAPYDAASYLRAAVVPILVVSVLVGLSLGVAGPWISEQVLDLPAEASSALWLWAVLIPFAALSDVLVSATRAFDRFAPVVLIEKVARPLAQLMLTVWAAWASLAVTSIVLLWALPYVASALWAMVWLRRLMNRDTVRPLVTSTTPWSEFWGFNWSLSLGSWVKVALQRLDVLIISALRGPVEAAVYVAATRFLVLGQFIGNSFSLSVQPLIARHAARSDREAVRQLYSATTVWLVLVSWPLYLSMITLAPILLSIFGDGYQDAAVVLQILAFAMMAATAIGPVDQVLIMSGRPTWVLANSVVALALNIVLNLLLVPGLGAVGGAIAWGTSILISNAFPLGQLYWWRRIHPFSRAAAGAGILAVACFGAVPLVFTSLVGPATFLTALASLLVSAVLYSGGTWLLRGAFNLDKLPMGRTTGARQ